MNKFLCCLSALAIFAFHGVSARAADTQNASPVQWTVIDTPNYPPVSTVADKGQKTDSKASSASKKSAPQEDRSNEIEKAIKNADSPKDMMKSPEISRESIDLIMAPYHTANKQEFLAIPNHDLSDIVERAKSVQTQAKAAHESISLSQRRMLLAIRQMFPEASFEYQHRDGSLSAAEYLSRSERASFRQPLFRGGVLWNSFLQERKLLEAARSNYQKVIDDMVLEISKSYFEYQRARATAEDQQKTLDSLKPQVEIANKKFKENISSEIEHLNVQSLVGQIEFDHETAKQEYEIAKLDLEHELAIGMGDNIQIKQEYDVDKVIASISGEEMTPAKIESALGSFNNGKPIPGLEQLVEMSYGHRAELSVQVSQLEAARYGERVRWGGFSPKADLVLEFGTLSEAFKEFTNNADHKGEFRMMLEVDWNAMGNKLNYTNEQDHRAPSVTQFQSGQGTINNRNSFSVGVLNGLDSFVDVKQAEVDKLNKVVELEQAEKKVLEEVKRAYYEYQKALIQMKSSITRVQWRKRLRDLAQHRLEQKEVEISEYVQSEIDLLKERGEFHTALKDYYTAKSSLNYAVGVQTFLATEKNGKA